MERHRATLPVPPGINRMYKTNREGHFYVDPAVKEWKDTARMLLRQAGWKKAIGTSLSMTIEMIVSERRDIDSGAKVLIDLACDTLGVDDRYLTDVHLHKTVESRRALQRVEIEVSIP